MRANCMWIYIAANLVSGSLSLSLSLSGSLAQLQLSWGCVSSTYPVELLHPCGLGSYVIALQGGMWGPEKLPYPPLKLVQISPHIAPLPL